MQKINLICVGNLKDKEYISMCEEYKKRISRFANINIIELKEKYLFNEILNKKIFKRFVVLSQKNGAGTIEGIFDDNFIRLV